MRFGGLYEELDRRAMAGQNPMRQSGKKGAFG